MPAGQGEGALLPGGQNEPGGQMEHTLEVVLLAVRKRPPPQDEGGAGGAGGGGGAGAPKAGDDATPGAAQTKGQPCGHQTMGQPLLSRP